MFKNLKEENLKLDLANQELRNENEELKLKLYHREKFIETEKKNNDELLQRIANIATSNHYNNSEVALRKIKELATAKLN